MWPHGWASGQAWSVHLRVEQDGDEQAAAAALNIGVRMTEIATTPKKKGQKLHASCLVPDMKNAGVCHTADTTPTTRAE